MKCGTRFSPRRHAARVSSSSSVSFWARVLVFLCLPTVVPGAFAAERALACYRERLTSVFSGAGPGRRIPVVWEIEWNEQTVAQGSLDFEIEDGNELLGSFHLSDVLLSPGKNVFNSMLPAMSVFSRSAPVTLRVGFVSGKQRYEFERQSLPAEPIHPVVQCRCRLGRDEQTDPEATKGCWKRSVGNDCFPPMIRPIAQQPFRSTCRRPVCPSNRSRFAILTRSRCCRRP